LNILLVTDSYPPEIRSASHLMLELAEELSLREHQITVITSWPKYNLAKSSKQDIFSEKKIENGKTILRIKTLPHHNVNYFLRGIAQLLMPLLFFLKLRKYKIRPDVVLIYSPPLPLALVGSLLRINKVSFVLNVQDLFPQNAIDLGILTNPLQIRFFSYLESFAYRTANVVTLHSEGNLRTVSRNYPDLSDKFEILHNWVDVNQLKAKSTSTDFRKKLNIQEKYVAIFAGVMGPSQYLELILYVAEKMQDVSELLFLLVGDGSEKDKLEKITIKKSLSNVRFEGFVSREDYPNLLEICSIGLVCLSPQNKTPVVPGKILGYMAAGLPIAAFLQSSSDGHSIIKTAKCGISADSADKETCVKSMTKLLKKGDSLGELGQDGKRFAKENFSKEVCISQLEKIFEQNML